MSLKTPPHAKVIGERELIFLVALMMSIHALSIDGMLPALDNMARELHVIDGNKRQLVVAVFLLCGGLGTLLPGAFADRFGRCGTGP